MCPAGGQNQCCSEMASGEMFELSGIIFQKMGVKFLMDSDNY